MRSRARRSREWVVTQVAVARNANIDTTIAARKGNNAVLTGILMTSFMTRTNLPGLSTQHKGFTEDNAKCPPILRRS